MTALALTLAGLAPGVLAALLYWVPRAAVRARALEDAEVRALAESAGGKALTERLHRVATIPIAAPELHIEVLRLRAHRLSAKLGKTGKPGDWEASNRIDKIIASGDREALIAILREENG